jgi:hypothetical protein
MLLDLPDLPVDQGNAASIKTLNSSELRELRD